MLVNYRQSSKNKSTAGKVVIVKWGLVIGRAVVFDYITVGGAVGVNYSAIGGSSRS